LIQKESLVKFRVRGCQKRANYFEMRLMEFVFGEFLQSEKLSCPFILCDICLFIIRKKYYLGFNNYRRKEIFFEENQRRINGFNAGEYANRQQTLHPIVKNIFVIEI